MQPLMGAWTMEMAEMCHTVKPNTGADGEACEKKFLRLILLYQLRATDWMEMADVCVDRSGRVEWHYKIPRRCNGSYNKRK